VKQRGRLAGAGMLLGSRLTKAARAIGSQHGRAMFPPTRAGSLFCQQSPGWRLLLSAAVVACGSVACGPGAAAPSPHQARVAEAAPVAAEDPEEDVAEEQGAAAERGTAAEGSAKTPAGAPEPAAAVEPEEQAAALPPAGPSTGTAASGAPSRAASAAETSGDAAEPAAEAEAPPSAVEAPALYVRLGDVLVPLACRRPRAWRAGKACLPSEDTPVQLQLQPTLQGESATRTGSLTDLPFVLAGTSERGLSLVKKERPIPAANRPLLGFGTVGSSSLLRFTKAGAQRIRHEASGWCASSKGICRGVAEKSLVRLTTRTGKPREQNDLIAQVRQAITPLAETLPIKVVALFSVSVGGRQQRIADVEVDTSNATSPKAAELQLPDSVHYLFTETAHGFRLSSVARDDGFGLGEAGELLAAIDLDADGTDELIVSWMYSEGRSWELLRRSGDKLLFVGGFTDGA
jgi:hypothetical protein